MPTSNEYMRLYVLARYEQRREAALKLLGNKYKECGSNNDLQFDHIDPKTKLHDLAKSFASLAQTKLDKEIQKCQLLCSDCHLRKKTPIDLGKQNVKGFDVHGTLSSARYCKCSDCKKAKNEYNRNWSKINRKSRKKINTTPS